MKARDLVTNADGKLSRTQITIWIALFLTVGLLLAEVLRGGGVLTLPVLGVLLGLHVFALLDRIDARHIDVRIGRDGAGISLGNDDPRGRERS